MSLMTSVLRGHYTNILQNVCQNPNCPLHQCEPEKSCPGLIELAFCLQMDKHFALNATIIQVLDSQKFILKDIQLFLGHLNFTFQGVFPGHAFDTWLAHTKWGSRTPIIISGSHGATMISGCGLASSWFQWYLLMLGEGQCGVLPLKAHKISDECCYLLPCGQEASGPSLATELLLFLSKQCNSPAMSYTIPCRVATGSWAWA